MKQRTLVITVAITVVSIALAVIVGFAVTNMSKASAPTGASGSEAPSGNASSLSEEPKESGSEEAAAPATKDSDQRIFHMDNTFRTVTAEELQALSASYNAEVKQYYTKPELNDKNRPVEASYFEAIFKKDLGDAVRVMNQDGQRVTLSFALAIEYEENTEYVLNYLSAKEVKAVFFVSYSYAFNHPEVIRRILTEGHTLGSMGYALPESGFARLSAEEQLNDLKKMHDYIFDTYGYSMDKFFYGDRNYSMLSMALLKASGYETCFYTVSYNDARHEDVLEASVFLDSMSGAAHDGAIYLLHTTNTASLIITPSLIDALREKGYEVGTYN